MLIIGAVVLASFDARFDGPLGSQESTWLQTISPYLPLWGLAIHPLVGFLTWVGAVLVLPLTDAPASGIYALLVPTAIVVGMAVHSLKRSIAVAISLVGALLAFFVPFFSYEDGAYLGAALVTPTIIAAAGGLALNSYRIRTSAQEHRIEGLEQEQESVRRQERRKLGSELHDTVAHDVTVIAMQARRTRFIDDPDQIQEIAASIGQRASEVLQNLRNMVVLLQEDNVLAPTPGSSVGGGRGDLVSPERIAAEIRSIETSLRNAGFDVTSSITGDLRKIPGSALPNLLRSVKEVGTNILKHANPRLPATIDLDVGETDATLSSVNGVSSAPPISSSKTGLAMMSARATAFGGTLEAGASDGVWTTSLSIPLTRVTFD